MSGVFRRNRTETKLQFYVNALELQIEITKCVINTSKMPKKYRHSQGYKLLDKVDRLVDCITIANSIYPNSLKNIFYRKIFQTIAIACCYSIQNKLILLERCVETVNVSHMESMIEKIAHEMELLKAWKKSTKIMQ